MATVAWNDPAQLGQPRLAIVEDPDAISRYGIQETEIEALGCTSEARRSAPAAGRFTPNSTRARR